MNELNTSNYYQRDPRKIDRRDPKRFPENHVRFSGFLQPLKWLDALYGMSGKRAFMLKRSVLREFDSAGRLAECLGTEHELKEVRNLVEAYCDGIDSNPFLSSIGRFLLKTITLNSLKKRKEVLHYYRSNKEYIEANGNFKSPVIITGFARSGTTLLQRLMSEDPNTRSPYTFELENPTPPMSSETAPLEDPRIKKSGAALSVFSTLAPGFLEKFAESHFWSPTEMEESLIYMLAHNCIHVMNNASAGKAYIDAFFSNEAIKPVFRYEKLFFEMLDAYRPAKTHWTLKAPIYAPFFPLISEEYPDARVVLTHRNPIYTFPSVCRIMESWHIAFDENGAFDKYQFARFQQAFMERNIQVPFAYRKEHPEIEGQVFDCMYEELFANPVEIVKRIYQAFDIEYTEVFERRMKEYLRENSQGKYGRHSYSLEEYGFTGEGLYGKYKEYMDHYGFRIPERIERPTSFDYNL